MYLRPISLFYFSRIFEVMKNIKGQTLNQDENLIAREEFQTTLLEIKGILRAKFDNITIFFDLEVKKWFIDFCGRQCGG
jgi:hypothetical protein